MTWICSYTFRGVIQLLARLLMTILTNGFPVPKKTTLTLKFQTYRLGNNISEEVNNTLQRRFLAVR